MGSIKLFSGEKVFESKKLIASYLVENSFWFDLKSQMVVDLEKCIKDKKGNILYIGQEKTFPPKKFEEAFEKLAKKKVLAKFIRTVKEKTP